MFRRYRGIADEVLNQITWLDTDKEFLSVVQQIAVNRTPVGIAAWYLDSRFEIIKRSNEIIK